MTEQSSLNGFTGFGKRDPHFQSAKDALRRTEQETAGWTRQRGGSGAAGGNLRPSMSGSLGFDTSPTPSNYRSAPYREPFGTWLDATQQASVYEGDHSLNGFDESLLESISGMDRRWAWVEIDLDAIAYNTRAIKHLLKPGTRLMAVVKADGYGHGALQSAKTALAAGAEWLGVATINEGIALRLGGVQAPIQLLVEPPLSSIPLLIAYEIVPSIYTTEFAIAYGEIAHNAARTAPYFLAINSGMNRIGVRYDEVLAFLDQVNFHKTLTLSGVFTHFATADADDRLDFTVQARRFFETVQTMRGAGINPGIVSAANSAAILRYPDVHFDMVRLGISLYGYMSSPYMDFPVALRPAMEVHCRITDVRSVPMSEGVSYGFTYRSPGSVRICTIPIGYGDGLRRILSNRIDVLLEGRRCRQVGNICMDQCMFEVNRRSLASQDRLDPHIGDEVVIVGRQGDEVIPIEELAIAADTITHEMTIGFGTSRLARFYRSH